MFGLSPRFNKVEFTRCICGRCCICQIVPELQNDLYAFPPFSITHKTIQKFLQDEEQGILIVSLWKTQPLFTLLIDIMYEGPIVFEVTDDELYLLFREGGHPLVGRLRMLASRCYQSFRKQGITENVIGTLLHTSCTLRMYRPHLDYGNGIVSPTGWIPLRPL